MVERHSLVALEWKVNPIEYSLQGRKARLHPGTQAGDQRTWHFPTVFYPAASSESTRDFNPDAFHS